MRKHRTIYFNDARHYYLFVYEPPMNLQDARRPIDEVVGTAVDTFVYGVERNDGLFYPSKHGIMFGDDMDRFESVPYWRAWKNLTSLIDQGYDPLQILIDRAHDKGLDFIASLRFAGYAGLKDEHRIPIPAKYADDQRFNSTSQVFTGADYAHQEVRDHQYTVLEELATDYPTDGVELDFSFSTFYFKPDEARQNLKVMTELVGRVSEMVRGRQGGAGLVGARILPTEAMCLNAGIDVRTWLDEGLLDYVVPLIYSPFYLDCDMPIDWLVKAAHEADAAVYGFLHPYRHAERERRFYDIAHAEPAMVRAAASNHFAKGVDGLYAWFLKWPFGDAERGILSDIGNPEQIGEAKKHYFIPWRSDRMALLGYDKPLPQTINVGRSVTVPFYISDDLDAKPNRRRQVLLRLRLDNIAKNDDILISLNGRSLDVEEAVRSYGGVSDPYQLQWLEFELKAVRPKKGNNEILISLQGRSEDLHGSIAIVDLEVIVE